MSSWKEQMWAELEGMDDVAVIVTSGEWIHSITHEILPALARKRREMIVQVVRQPGMDSTLLAETIGSRRNAIERLLGEGRRAEREKAPPVAA